MKYLRLILSIPILIGRAIIFGWPEGLLLSRIKEILNGEVVLFVSYRDKDIFTI